MSDTRLPSSNRALGARFHAWAGTVSSPAARQMVVHLADICTAATTIVSLAERLDETAAKDRRATGRALVELQAWLYDELGEHLASMKEPLESLIVELHSD
jgi:hypothetical protein